MTARQKMGPVAVVNHHQDHNIGGILEGAISTKSTGVWMRHFE